MSLRFSRVTLEAEGCVTIIFVGGVPDSRKELQGWKDFDMFLENVTATDTIVAHVEAFLYGGEDPVDATPEEVAYIYKRVGMRPDFIEKRTDKYGEADLVIPV